MSKIKMRCITCGKWFQSANAKDVTCPDCTQKARREKQANRSTPPTANTRLTGSGPTIPARPTPPPPPKPKPTTSGTNQWLDSLNDVKVGQPDQPQRKYPPSPPQRDNRGGQERGGYRGPGNYRENDYRTPGPGGYREGNTRGPGTYRENDYRTPGPGGYRGPGTYRENDYRTPNNYRVGGMGIPGQRPRQPIEGGFNRPPTQGGQGENRVNKFRQGGKKEYKPTGQRKAVRPAPPPKPKREKIPPPAPFVPTPEQVAQVEVRYRELATPAEYDGIRSQIAKEMGIPKSAVKKIIKEYREREHLPSWWELQTYKGSNEELERIKAVYEPLLPVAPVGVHKQIAEQLSLKPGVVYQAIKAIRQELNLPQYNDPEAHEGEFIPLPQVHSPEETVNPDGKVASIETDIQFQRQGDTLEVAVTTGDEKATNEA